MFSKIDQDKYFNMLKAVASMSSLYSSQDSPLIHYRFIENLFTKTSLIKAELIAHKDMSFDCRLENKVGVGIKTFVSKSQNATEKIAEFNKISKNLKNMKMILKNYLLLLLMQEMKGFYLMSKSMI